MLVGPLVDAGTLTIANLRGLELLATTLASASAFAAIVERDGLVIASPTGALKAHPGLQALGQARAQARALLSDFGLLPRGRSGVEAAPPAPSNTHDPLDEFRRADAP